MLLVPETANKTRWWEQDKQGRMGPGTGFLPGVTREEDQHNLPGSVQGSLLLLCGDKTREWGLGVKQGDW